MSEPDQTQALDERDWTDEQQLEPALQEAELGERPGERFEERDIDFHRETTRSQLARWLMALLTIVVLTLLMLAGLRLAGILNSAGPSVRDLAQAVLTPVVTLTGTALGFYYGAHSFERPGNGGRHYLTVAPRRPGLARRIWRRVW